MAPHVFSSAPLPTRTAPPHQDMVARRINWLTAIKQWQGEFLGSISAREFVDAITGDFLQKGVFAFTPDGEVINLPRGSTVVDFAYHIHTEVGNVMLAARVNNRLVPPSHVLANGDVVNVLCSERVTPTVARRHAE